VDLDSVFDEMSVEEKSSVLEQIADILVVMQRLELPAGVGKHSGMSFDGGGNIICGEMAVLEGGPWDSYGDVMVAKMKAALKNDADPSSVVGGWRANGLRERLDKFIAGGVGRALDDVDVQARGFVHGDFSKSSSFSGPPVDHGPC
jgi:hypothetical protein